MYSTSPIFVGNSDYIATPAYFSSIARIKPCRLDTLKSRPPTSFFMRLDGSKILSDDNPPVSLEANLPGLDTATQVVGNVRLF